MPDTKNVSTFIFAMIVAALSTTWDSRSLFGGQDSGAVPETVSSRVDQSEKYNGTQQFEFSPDGRWLVEISERENTRLRSTATGKKEFLLPEDSDYKKIVSAVVPHALPVQYRFCTRSKSSTIELFSIDERRRLGEIRIDGRIEFGVVSDDGRTIACWMNGGPVILLNAVTGERTGQIEPPTGMDVCGIAIDSSGSQLAVSFQSTRNDSNQRQTTVIYSTASQNEMTTFDIAAYKMQFTADDQHLVMLRGSEIVVQSLEDRQRSVSIDKIAGSKFELSGNGRLLFMELDERFRETKSCVIGAFDLTTGSLVHKFTVSTEFRHHDYSAARIRVSPDGRQLAVLIGGSIIWWTIPEELASPRCIVPQEDHSVAIGGSGIVPEPKTIPLLRYRKLGAYRSQWFIDPTETTLSSIKESDLRDEAGQAIDALLIRRVDSRTGRSIDRTVAAGSAGVPQLSSRDGRVWLAHGKGVDFWNAERLGMIGSHSNEQTGRGIAALAPDGSFALISGQSDLIVRHEPAGGRVNSRILTADFKSVSHLAISHDNRRAVAVMQGGKFQVWTFDLNDPATRTELTKVPGIGDCREIMFSHDGKSTVMTDEDECVVWSAETGEVVRRIKYEEIGYGLDVSADGNWIATFAEDETGRFVAIWELESGHLLARLSVGETRFIPTLRFSAGGRHVLGLDEKNFQVWDISVLGASSTDGPSHGLVSLDPTGRSARSVASEADAVPLLLKLNFNLKTIAFTAEENVMAGDGQRIDLSTGTNRTCVYDLDLPTVRLWQSARGDRFAAVNSSHVDSRSEPLKRTTPQLALWSSDDRDYLTTTLEIPLPPSKPVNGRRRLATHTHHCSFGDYTWIDVNSGQNRLATIHQNGRLFLWTVGRVFDPTSYRKYHRGRAECFVTEVAESMLSARFLPERDVLLASGESGLTAFHATSGKSIGRVAGPKGTIYQIEFDPRGTRMVTFGSDGLELWQLQFEGDRATAERSAVVLSSDNPVTVFRFSPDNSVLAIGFENMPPLLYDVVGCRFWSRCAGSGFGCRDLSFSPDNRQVAGACNDGKLRIWNLQK